MKRVLVLSLALVFAVASGAWATSYSGSEGNETNSTIRFDVGGMGTYGNAWQAITNSSPFRANQGVHIDWTVNDTANAGYWTYTYTFTENTEVNGKQVVAFYLGFGGSSTDIVSQTLMGYSTRNTTDVGAIVTNLGVVGAPVSGYAPVGGPGAISGLGWAFPTSPVSYSFILTLVTKDAPVWGDYLAIGPVAGGNGATMMAWDLGFGTTSSDPIGPQTAGYNYVMTPGAAPVPIPPSILLLAPGLVGIVAMRKRAKK